MATQTIEFRAAPSQTVTAKLFAVGSDTVVDSQAATEATNRKGTYSADYADVAAGEYELIAFAGATPLARWFVTLTLTTATFQVYEKCKDISEGGDATLAKQEEILTQLDVVQAQTDLICSASGLTSLLAAAVLEPGTITSFPETLTIGDSYTEQNGREIQIPIVDSDGVPISSTGSLNFADATVTFTLQRSGETDSTRVITGSATFVDPPGTGTGAGAPYAVIELTSSETAKGLKKYKYSGILTFTWAYAGTGTADDVMSFETDTVTFDN